MYYVYILQSLKDDKTYVGYTSNLDERLKRHNSGQATATKDRRPLKLIYSEELETIAEAKDRERYWKSGAGRRKMRKMLIVKT